MHKCVRCDRAATTIQEINDGCPCGSKVFVFIRDNTPSAQQENEASLEKSPSQISVDSPKLEFSSDAGGKKDADGAQQAEEGAKAAAPPDATAASPSAAEPNGNGKAPPSYFARMTFTTEDVENIKIVSEGVFAVDINALSKNPVVLKDEEGVYYVRLPFEQKKK